MSSGPITELRWIASGSTSAVHAAACLLQGQALTDAALADALRPAAEALRAAADLAGVDSPLLLSHLLPQSATIENNLDLARHALRKCLPTPYPTHVERVALAIAELEQQFTRRHPKALDELTMRARPLRELWEARGPGLLRMIGRLTEEAVLPPRSDVILVLPVLGGGGGAAHMLYNVVHIEAVLANPLERLPEVVRLGWLLSQLQLELPRFGETISRHHLPRLAALAMIPATLAAAQHVELTGSLEEAGIQLALNAWQPNAPGRSGPLAAVLLDWWQTYVEARPHFATALLALEKMLAEATETEEQE